jgi:two-component sensor histidine kinase
MSERVALDRYLFELCRGLAAASSSLDREWPIVVDADPLTICTDVGVPLGLIVNELVTNAIQHSSSVGDSRSIRVVLKARTDAFSISVSDPGDGPAVAETHTGLGTRIVDTLAKQINAAVVREQTLPGYTVTVTVPQTGARTERVDTQPP